MGYSVHTSVVVARHALGVLEMREVCERCSAPLPAGGDARICSYECTFCPDCATAMNAICPNCSGELVTRPTRAS
jgi:uncharacterized protein